MTSTPSTAERSRLLLEHWRKNLTLTTLEKKQLAGELKILDCQLERLKKKILRIAVFGRVGVGKSSLLNALLGEEFFSTDVAHGCTRNTQTVLWKQPIKPLQSIYLIDTPGIDEISAKARGRLAARVALQSDLVLLVLDSDITNIELDALEVLLSSGKPIFLVLNRSDQWANSELKELMRSIHNRLPSGLNKLPLEAVAAAPRECQLQVNGRIRSIIRPPQIKSLHHSLVNLLTDQGELLLALNALRQADHFQQSLKNGRLTRSKTAAQSLIGKFAAIKASGVAANPLLILDLAGGLACDTALIIQLSKLYGLEMGGYSARQLLKRLSLYNSLLGGAQFGIQFALGALRQLLIITTPLTGGLTLAPAAPIAIAQAALAIHTTKLTGRLAAQTFLNSKQSKGGGQPSSMLRRLAKSDPATKHWLEIWPKNIKTNPINIQVLLP